MSLQALIIVVIVALWSHETAGQAPTLSAQGKTCDAGATCLRGNFPAGGVASSPFAPPCWLWEGTYYSCFEYDPATGACPWPGMTDCKTSVTEGNLTTTPPQTTASPTTATPITIAPTTAVPTRGNDGPTGTPVQENDQGGKLSAGAIAGITAGSVFAVLIVILALLVLRGKSFKRPSFLPESVGERVSQEPIGRLSIPETPMNAPTQPSITGSLDQPLLYRL